MSYIARLRGIVEEKGRDNVVVDVGGVGYEVNVPGSTLARIGRRCVFAARGRAWCWG